MYKGFIKRFFDIILSAAALIMLLPLMLFLTLFTAVNMRGNPFFIQLRPGKDGKVFRLIKFRTMTCDKDNLGNYLPDSQRLTPYGSFLRSVSLDELPELFNILKGDMSIIGPRPQLVKDMVFFNDRVMLRQSVRPGLTGLAQVNGRNRIDWEQRFDYDLEYVEKFDFWLDLKILFKTVLTVFKRENVCSSGMATSEDYGDYLLRAGSITEEYYRDRLKQAR